MSRTSAWPGILALLWVGLLAWPAVARAEPAPTAKQEARERFDRGLRLFDQGDDGGALAEFRRAYELIPHPLVLYNIGLVYEAMNRPVQAVDALERLLASPGALSQAQLDNARRVLGEQRARIASLSVQTNVPAGIEVDGVIVGKTPMAKPLRIAGGVHVVGAVAKDHAPQRREVSVAGGASVQLVFELEPLGTELASLRLVCPVPDADVLVDGKSVGKTPLSGTLAFPAGRREVSVSRLGYRTARSSVVLAPGSTVELELGLVTDPAQLARHSGTLELRISEPDATIHVDGVAIGQHSGALRLPVGRHTLRIEREGFSSFERLVDVPAGGATTVAIDLVPTPAHREAYVQRTRSRRAWGWVSVLTGGVVAAGSGGFLLWNRSEERGKEDDFDAAFERKAQGDCSKLPTLTERNSCEAEPALLVDELDTIRGRYVYGFVGLGVGVVALGTGTYLLLSGDDPDRYEPKPRSDVFGGLRLLPSATALPGGVAAGVVGTF